MKWTRSELKERAKEALRRNYWKVVFVSFIFIMLSGGVSYSSSSSIVGGGEREKADNPVPVETDIPDNEGILTGPARERMRQVRADSLRTWHIPLATASKSAGWTRESAWRIRCYTCGRHSNPVFHRNARRSGDRCISGKPVMGRHTAVHAEMSGRQREYCGTRLYF